MSAIIKSTNLVDLSEVRPFAAPGASPSGALRHVDDEMDRLRKRITQLEGAVREREQTISLLRSDIERAFQDGKSEGHADGLADADRREQARLARVGAALQDARETLNTKLAALDRLAPLLAQDCLDKILGPSPDRTEQLRAIMKRQLDAIEKSALVAIELSREDFSEASVAGLTSSLGVPAESLRVSGELASGACVMILKLGRIDVGLDRQWGVLSDLLGQLALPESGA